MNWTTCLKKPLSPHHTVCEVGHFCNLIHELSVLTIALSDFRRSNSSSSREGGGEGGCKYSLAQ